MTVDVASRNALAQQRRSRSEIRLKLHALHRRFQLIRRLQLTDLADLRQQIRVAHRLRRILILQLRDHHVHEVRGIQVVGVARRARRVRGR